MGQLALRNLRLIGSMILFNLFDMMKYKLYHVFNTTEDI